MFQIKKYKTESGKCPLDEFVKELLSSGQREEILKIKFYIELLEKLGEGVLSNSNWAKYLGDGIYELRPKSTRVLYIFCDDNNAYILLHGFKKKQQKTPKCEIDRAKKEANDYIRRIKDE